MASYNYAWNWDGCGGGGSVVGVAGVGAGVVGYHLLSLITSWPKRPLYDDHLIQHTS